MLLSPRRSTINGATIICISLEEGGRWVIPGSVLRFHQFGAGLTYRSFCWYLRRNAHRLFQLRVKVGIILLGGHINGWCVGLGALLFDQSDRHRPMYHWFFRAIICLKHGGQRLKACHWDPPIDACVGNQGSVEQNSEKQTTNGRKRER